MQDWQKAVAFTIPPTTLDARISRKDLYKVLEEVARVLRSQGQGIEAHWIARKDEDQGGEVVFPALVALGWEFIPANRSGVFWVHNTSRLYLAWHCQPKTKTHRPVAEARELAEKINRILF